MLSPTDTKGWKVDCEAFQSTSMLAASIAKAVEAAVHAAVHSLPTPLKIFSKSLTIISK